MAPPAAMVPFPHCAEPAAPAVPSRSWRTRSRAGARWMPVAVQQGTRATLKALMLSAVGRVAVAAARCRCTWRLQWSHTALGTSHAQRWEGQAQAASWMVEAVKSL